jgi:hypothetical protein
MITIAEKVDAGLNAKGFRAHLTSPKDGSVVVIFDARLPNDDRTSIFPIDRRELASPRFKSHGGICRANFLRTTGV